MRGLAKVHGAVTRRSAIVLAAVTDPPFALPTAPAWFPRQLQSPGPNRPSYVPEVCASLPNAAHFQVQGRNQFGDPSYRMGDSC